MNPLSTRDKMAYKRFHLKEIMNLCEKRFIKFSERLFKVSTIMSWRNVIRNTYMVSFGFWFKGFRQSQKVHFYCCCQSFDKSTDLSVNIKLFPRWSWQDNNFISWLKVFFSSNSSLTDLYRLRVWISFIKGFVIDKGNNTWSQP